MSGFSSVENQLLTLVDTMYMNVPQNHVRHTPQYIYYVCHLRSKPFDNLLTKLAEHNLNIYLLYSSTSSHLKLNFKFITSNYTSSRPIIDNFAQSWAAPQSWGKSIIPLLVAKK